MRMFSKDSRATQQVAAQEVELQVECLRVTDCSAERTTNADPPLPNEVAHLCGAEIYVAFASGCA